MASQAIIRLLHEMDQRSHSLQQGRKSFGEALKVINRAKAALRRQHIRKYNFKKTK